MRWLHRPDSLAHLGECFQSWLHIMAIYSRGRTGKLLQVRGYVGWEQKKWLQPHLEHGRQLVLWKQHWTGWVSGELEFALAPTPFEQPLLLSVLSCRTGENLYFPQSVWKFHTTSHSKGLVLAFLSFPVFLAPSSSPPMIATQVK